MDDKEKLKKELASRREHCRIIVDNLKNNEAFNMLINDFKNLLSTADDSWHLIPSEDKNKLMELRINKIAGLSIVNVISNYENEIVIIDKELAEINSPNTIQSSYYDTE